MPWKKYLSVTVQDGEATKSVTVEIPDAAIVLGALAPSIAAIVAEARRKLAMPDDAQITRWSVVG